MSSTGAGDNAVSPGQWIPLTSTTAAATLIRAADLADGSVREAIAGDRVVAVGRAGGELFALDGICLHAGGPLGEGHLNGEVLTCPWHGWQYDIRNGRNCLNARVQTKCFPIRTEPGGHVSVLVE